MESDSISSDRASSATAAMNAAEIKDPALEKLIERDAGRLGFRITKRVVELQGTCAHCLSLDGTPGEN